MMNKRLSIFLTVSIVTLTLQNVVLADTTSTALKTITGNNNAELSINVAEELKSQTNTYVIASSDNFPDATSGTVLASKYKAPILFVSNNGDNSEIFNYLSTNANKNTQFYILGGTGAISQNIENSLRAISSNITRLFGSDRYETNSVVNDYLNVPAGTPIILASGENYPDALSIGGIGGQRQYPLFLTELDVLSQHATEQLEKINPSTIYIAGGTGVVSADLESQIRSMFPSANIVRFAGTDRYDTSAKIANYFKQSKTIYTTGEDFHPALVAAPLAAQNKASITLINNTNNEIQTNGYVIGSIPSNNNATVTSLTDSDISRLQSYPQYSSINGVDTGELYTSFQNMYNNRLGECKAAMSKFSPVGLSDYTNAKVNWLSSPKLVYYSAEGQYCIRGILDLTFYGSNKFSLNSNQEYQVDVEYRIEALVKNGAKSISLDKTIYLSDFKAVN